MIKDALVIFRKEMKNLAKDKRTLMFIIVFPLVLMPLIFGTIGGVTKRQQVNAEEASYHVIIQNNGDPQFRSILSKYLTYTTSGGAGDVSLVVSFPEGYIPGDVTTATVYYESTSSKSAYAASRIQAALNAYSEALAAARLKQVNLSLADVHTIQIRKVDTAPEQAQGAGILAMLLPYLITIYVFSGSMNIGIDTTAGEKERGSLASVLVNQVSRTSIALGKVMYVVCAALINSVSSFIGIMIALQILGQSAPGEITSSLSVFSAGTIIGLLFVLFSLSGLAASVIVLIGSFARNMKEGGSYVLPIYIIVIVVGVATMQMDVSGNLYLFLIPIVNAVFTMKEILTGQIAFLHVLLTLVMNAGVAALLIGGTARLFNTERILNTI